MFDGFRVTVTTLRKDGKELTKIHPGILLHTQDHKEETKFLLDLIHYFYSHFSSEQTAILYSLIFFYWDN